MTLSTSVIKTAIMKKMILGYGVATIFCFVFQLVYAQFSHGVDSPYMTYSFLIPFAGGAISTLGLFLWGKTASSAFRQLICGGTIWFTLGCIFKGVLEIYGTTNHMAVVFTVLGLAQLLAAFLTILRRKNI